jgi:hypothetical protein
MQLKKSPDETFDIAEKNNNLLIPIIQAIPMVIGPYVAIQVSLPSLWCATPLMMSDE